MEKKPRACLLPALLEPVGGYARTQAPHAGVGRCGEAQVCRAGQPQWDGRAPGRGWLHVENTVLARCSRVGLYTADGVSHRENNSLASLEHQQNPAALWKQSGLVV